MTKFPTQAHWFDSIWPDVSYIDSEDKDPAYKILVPIHRHTDFEELEPNIIDNPKVIFMLVVEDFDHFCASMPAQWLRMPPSGGIPPNVWVGASVHTQQEADERMKRLVAIRARKLFVMLKKDHDQRIDLSHGLIAWRCSKCGRKGGYARLKRPGVCPTGTVCIGSDINPQIHWVVSMDLYGKNYYLASKCADLGVAFWDGERMEVPE